MRLNYSQSELQEPKAKLQTDSEKTQIDFEKGLQKGTYKLLLESFDPTESTMTLVIQEWVTVKIAS